MYGVVSGAFLKKGARTVLQDQKAGVTSPGGVLDTLMAEKPVGQSAISLRYLSRHASPKEHGVLSCKLNETIGYLTQKGELTRR